MHMKFSCDNLNLRLSLGGQEAGGGSYADAYLQLSYDSYEGEVDLEVEELYELFFRGVRGMNDNIVVDLSGC